jgi:hypothetical protein
MTEGRVADCRLACYNVKNIWYETQWLAPRDKKLLLKLSATFSRHALKSLLHNMFQLGRVWIVKPTNQLRDSKMYWPINNEWQFYTFWQKSSTCLSDYVLTHSTTRSTDPVSMTYTYTTDFIKAISVVARINCGKLCTADPSGRAGKGVGLWPLACYDCGFEFRGQQRCELLVSDLCVVWNLPLRGADHSSRWFALNVVSVYDTESSKMRTPWSTRAVDPWKTFGIFYTKISFFFHSKLQRTVKMKG